jgi:hypothetical protein
MTESTQEDVHRLHANTRPFYIRNKHPQIVVSMGDLETNPPMDTKE